MEYMVLKRDTIMYRLNWREYMVERNINLDLITIIDSSMVSFIVFFCSFVFVMVHLLETRIMELLLFQRWFSNLVVRTLHSSSKWLIWDVNKTWNKVFVANIPWLWFQPVQFFDWSKYNNQMSILTIVI